MSNKLGQIHRWLGLIAVLVFFSTGVIMRMHHLNLLPEDSGLRMLFRSRHIYMLFCGLLNLAVGLRYSLPDSGRGSRIGVIGSLLILIAPLLMAAAFFTEPLLMLHVGPLSIFGVYAAVAGMLFYGLAAWPRKNQEV
jgi:hypothetical protein